MGTTCQTCYGTGFVRDPDTGLQSACETCGGSGQVNQ